MNIEEHFVRALRDAGFSAYAEVPKDTPDEFVTVEMTGMGRVAPGVSSATLAVQSWARSRYKASVLAYAVDQEMAGLSSADGTPKVSRNSIYNFPDPDSGRARYQGVYDVVAYDN